MKEHRPLLRKDSIPSSKECSRSLMKGFRKQGKRKTLRVFSKALEKDKFINLFINQLFDSFISNLNRKNHSPARLMLGSSDFYSDIKNFGKNILCIYIIINHTLLSKSNKKTSKDILFIYHYF